MNSPELKSSVDTQEVPSNLHRDIMRSVKVVKTRYYLFGLATGFAAALLAMSWVVYMKMLDDGTFEFLPVLTSILRNNFSMITDFGAEILEFLPLENIGIWIVLLLITILLMLIVFRFRKALFSKVENFSGRNTDQKDNK